MKIIPIVILLLNGPILLVGQDQLSIGDSDSDFFSYKLNISDSSAQTVGLAVRSKNPLSRSTILAGESQQGKYVYMAYNNPAYTNPNSAFRPSSGVLLTGGENGLHLISEKDDIYFVAGGLQTSDLHMIIKSDGNVGIGTETPNAKLEIHDGDIYINDINKGVILKSPDGKCWRYQPDNTGELLGTQVTCPNQ